MNFFDAPPLDIQAKPPVDRGRFGFDPQPEPRRPALGLLRPAVQA